MVLLKTGKELGLKNRYRVTMCVVVHILKPRVEAAHPDSYVVKSSCMTPSRVFHFVSTPLGFKCGRVHKVPPVFHDLGCDFLHGTFIRNIRTHILDIQKFTAVDIFVKVDLTIKLRFVILS